MENRCECYRSMGDPTGEKAVLCNAPGTFCPVCAMTVCAECHPEIASAQCGLAKKSPQNILSQEPSRRRQA